MQSRDYFDVPLENMEAALAHQSTRARPRNVMVPTRTEVETLPPDELHLLIHKWIYKSAIEIIPSRKQIAQVLETLRSRTDICTSHALVALCEAYVEQGRAGDSSNATADPRMASAQSGNS